MDRVGWLVLAVISSCAALWLLGMLVDHAVDKGFVLSRMFHPWFLVLLAGVMVLQTIMCLKASRE